MVGRYEVPGGDFCAYLKGFWKRNLEWRQFGAGFAHLRATNNVVSIEEDADAARQPATQCDFRVFVYKKVFFWLKMNCERAGSCGGRSADRTGRRTS